MERERRGIRGGRLDAVLNQSGYPQQGLFCGWTHSWLFVANKISTMTASWPSNSAENCEAVVRRSTASLSLVFPHLEAAQIKNYLRFFLPLLRFQRGIAKQRSYKRDVIACLRETIGPRWI